MYFKAVLQKQISFYLFMGHLELERVFLVRDTSREIAEGKGRKFVEWNKLTREEKQEAYEYPEKYF